MRGYFSAAVIACGILTVSTAQGQVAKGLYSGRDLSLGVIAAEPLSAMVAAAPASSPLDSTKLPSSMDLSRYFPPTYSEGQGLQGSCVSWAIAYGALSYYYRAGLAKPLTVMDPWLFSPSFVHNLQSEGNSCAPGIYVRTALNHLKYYGSLPFSQFGYDQHICNTRPNDKLYALAKNFRISDWERFSPNTKEIKKRIASGHPVIVALDLDDTFDKLFDNVLFRQRYGLYLPTEDGRKIGLHAVLISGYDDFYLSDPKSLDLKSRGAFKILNSWGDQFGSDGYFWLSYDHQNTIVESYRITDPNPPKHTPEIPAQKLPNEFKVKSPSGPSTAIPVPPMAEVADIAPRFQTETGYSGIIFSISGNIKYGSGRSLTAMVFIGDENRQLYTANEQFPEHNWERKLVVKKDDVVIPSHNMDLRYLTLAVPYEALNVQAKRGLNDSPVAHSMTAILMLFLDGKPLQLEEGRTHLVRPFGFIY